MQGVRGGGLASGGSAVLPGFAPGRVGVGAGEKPGNLRAPGSPTTPGAAREPSPGVLTAHGLSETWLAGALSMEQK